MNAAPGTRVRILRGGERLPGVVVDSVRGAETTLYEVCVRGQYLLVPADFVEARA